MVNCTVIRRPFQSCEAFAISSPTFLGLSPKGPILGARADVAPTSPPTARRQTEKLTNNRLYNTVIQLTIVLSFQSSEVHMPQQVQQHCRAIASTANCS